MMKSIWKWIVKRLRSLDEKTVYQFFHMLLDALDDEQVDKLVKQANHEQSKRQSHADR